MRKRLRDAESSSAVPYGDFVTPLMTEPANDAGSSVVHSVIRSSTALLKRFFANAPPVPAVEDVSAGHGNRPLRDFFCPAIGDTLGTYFTTDRVYLRERYHAQVAFGAVLQLKDDGCCSEVTVVGDRGGLLFVMDGDSLSVTNGDARARPLQLAEKEAVTLGHFSLVGNRSEALRSKAATPVDLPLSVKSFLQNAPDLSIYRADAEYEELVTLTPFAKRLPEAVFPSTFQLGWCGNDDSTKLATGLDGSEHMAFRSIGATVSLPFARLLESLS